MSFTPEDQQMIASAVTSTYKDVVAIKMKEMDARKIVPFAKKAEDWDDILKYWVSKGYTEIEFKSKTDTDSNNLNMQLQTGNAMIKRFPIELTIPYVVYKGFEKTKNGLVNYIKSFMMKALQSYDMFVNDLCLVGAKDSFSGLVNDNDIHTYTFTNTLAGAGTDIYKEINEFLHLMVTRSKKAFTPHQLCVSTNVYTTLINNTVGVNAITLLDKLLAESPYLRTSSIKKEDVIIQLAELDGVGVGGKDRMILLADDENESNYYFEESMQMQVLTEGFDAKKYFKEWENRSGGLMINQLKSIQYGDIAL